MSEDRVRVCIQSEVDSEELFFKDEDQKLIRALREKTAKEANEKYQEEHKYHCFRCGTKSLVEVEKGDVKIDICSNENCGAVHLDPGELDELLKDSRSIHTVRKSFIAIFSK